MDTAHQPSSKAQLERLLNYSREHGGVVIIDVYLPGAESPRCWRGVIVHFEDGNRAHAALPIDDLEELIIASEAPGRAKPLQSAPWRDAGKAPWRVLPSVRRVRQVPLIDEIFRGKATLP